MQNFDSNRKTIVVAGVSAPAPRVHLLALMALTAELALPVFACLGLFDMLLG